jgi:hypothetical protein
MVLLCTDDSIKSKTINDHWKDNMRQNKQTQEEKSGHIQEEALMQGQRE